MQMPNFGLNIFFIFTTSPSWLLLLLFSSQIIFPSSKSSIFILEQLPTNKYFSFNKQIPYGFIKLLYFFNNFPE